MSHLLLIAAATMLVLVTRGAVAGRHMVFDDAHVPDLLRDSPSSSSFLKTSFLHLCMNLSKKSATENSVVSPLSIVSLLALLMAGSQGVTRREIQKLFGIGNIENSSDEVHKTMAELFEALESIENAKERLEFGSGLFLQTGYPISSNFAKLASSVYRSHVLAMDFAREPAAAAAAINKWVSSKTHGHIKTLIDGAIDPATALIIANAFFFKGDWAMPLNPKFTRRETFHLNEKEEVDVEMMGGVVKGRHFGRRGQHSVVGLPYSSGDITMYLVLPPATIPLSSFIHSLTPAFLQRILNQTTQQEVILTMPKFRLESTLLLKEPLHKLGLRSLFDRRRVNLSGIGPPGLYVSELVHKVSLEVTEAGTEAAAATAQVFMRGNFLPTFRADRPFFFFIHHAPSDSVLFYGTVYRPTW